MLKEILLFIVCVFSVNTSLLAQEYNNSSSSDEEEKEPGLELVVSGLVIYTPEHSNFDFATEIHLTYWTTHKWAFGVGYTMIFEEDNRIGHELAALISHKPWSFLTLNAGPSVSLPNSHKDTEVSAYLEGEFAFKLGDFHVGPTVGALISEEFKIFGGFHISYEF